MLSAYVGIQFPLGIQSPLSWTGKTGPGQFCTASRLRLTPLTHTHSHLQVAAAAVHPWPWCNLSPDFSLKQGCRLPSSPFAPHGIGQPAKQAEAQCAWHAVDLQEDSSSSAPSAGDSTDAAADAFRVHSLQQLQVHWQEQTHTTFVHLLQSALYM